MNLKRYQAALFFPLMLLLSTQANAEDKLKNASPHLEHTRWIAGARGVQLIGAREGNIASDFGVGISLERNAIEGWLELEVAAAFLRPEDAWVIPVDFLLKKPFHFGPLCPYFGFGIAASIEFENEILIQTGPSAVLGSYYWFSDHIGIDFEVEYNVLFSKRGAAQEVVVALGPSFRF